MIAALDLATGQIIYRIRARKRWREFLAFLKLFRQRWPGQWSTGANCGRC